MTTLHSLVTISELFAGFNLINTGIMNCLIMCQNACKMHPSEAKIKKKNSGVPKPHPHWRGDTPSLNHTSLPPLAPLWANPAMDPILSVNGLSPQLLKIFITQKWHTP